MSSMQEDIQCAGKDNGENIMKSIKEGPFQMGTVSDVITGGTEGAVQQGPVRARVLNDLSAEEKERYKADIRATNILLQGIPKDIYSLINHYTDAKDIWERGNDTGRNKATFKDGKVVVQDVREGYKCDKSRKTHFKKQCKRKCPNGNVEAPEQRRHGLIMVKQNPSSSTTVNARHIALECPRAKATSRFRLLQDQMLIMQAQRVSKYWMKNSHCFLQGTEHFVGVQKALFKEVKEMEEIFDQMNNEVDKNTVDKQCAEIEKKNLLIENENLIVNCLSTQLLECLNLQLKYQHLQESFDNKNSQASQEAPDFNSFFKIKNLEHQIKEKDNVIRHLKDLVASVNDRSREPHNDVDVTALIEQNDCDRVELEKVKQHYKELYDSIKINRAHTSEKTSTMLNEIESLKAQLRSKEHCLTSDYVKPKVLAPGMYAIDVQPIPHPLKNNRSAHLNYISHLKESVETVREIVEEARIVKPLDISLNYACRYTKLSQELLECVIGTCPQSSMKEITRHTKSPESSIDNIHVHPSTGVNDSTKASGSKPRSNTKKNRILPAKKKKLEVRLRTNKYWLSMETHRKETHLRKMIVDSHGAHRKGNLPLWEICQLTKLSMKCTTLYANNSFIGSVPDGNDHLGAIMGYGDYVMGDSVISRVYYVEGLGHNLFSVGQFCDSDLEVAFRKHTCFVRDIKGTYILKGSRGTNLYTISIDEMLKSSPICLLSKASKSKSWLWHRRLNHLNFGTINDLARKDLVRGLPRLKFEKDHLCSACQPPPAWKKQEFSHRPKS
ncbi:integrase, catalytic region, zinc finger, CCHC-type containing protein [Tanacetum coccineum]